jgi:hypothetical protein
MSEDPEELTRIANKGFSELLKAGFKLFGRNWLKIIIPISFFYVISLLIRTVLLTDANWDLILMEATVTPLVNADPTTLTPSQLNAMLTFVFTTWGIDTLNYIISALFTTLGLCSVAMYLYKNYFGEKISLTGSMKGAFNRKMIIVLIILGVFIPLGNLMLVIPAIVIFGFYIFSIYTYQLDNTERSIKEAKSLSKGAFWKIVGTFIVSYLIIFTINIFYQLIIEIAFPVSYSTLVSWYYPLSRRFDLIFIYNLMNDVVLILLEPLFVCLLTPLFIQMKSRKRLGYAQIADNYQKVYIPPTQPEYVENGIYCPFCGQHMDFKLKYCPSCGESIDFLTN